MLNIEKYFPIKLVNYLSINPSIGINYSWGNLTLADSVYSSILVESYLTNPPIIYEFSIKRIALNFGLGININLLEHEVINENRTIKYFYTINLNTNFLLPIHYDFLSGPNDKDYLRNSAGQAIYGLSTDFPYGFIFGIRLGFDKVTTY
ncbi:MAG: hypothetical protein EPN82_14755 [Bacteroidetes bacterium]|nr:MAG: hypothetical protein EPN82_14755 [Bacteroidota bacterium]